MQAVRQRVATGREEGFTLIELMVVVLIIAILIAIAIPTFLGVRNKAYDRAAESTLRTSLVEAKSLFTDAQDYSTATVAAMQAREPQYTFQTPASTTPNTVSMVSTTPNWAGAAMSKSGTCFYISDTPASGTRYGSTATAANCTGTLAAAANSTSW